ncbi:Cytohesin-interacting protein, partial [Chaetura pelagica]
RHLVAILKEDKETFGFEIQTIRFPHENDCSLEVCTCVCKVQEESPAHLSGLQMGDILASINGVNTDGFSHKQIVDLIKSSGNYLRLETINGATFLRKMELEAKLQLLKGAALMLRVGEAGVGEHPAGNWGRDNRRGCCSSGGMQGLRPLQHRHPSCHPEPLTLLFVSCTQGSRSSSRSRLSSVTLGSEDSFCQGGAFEDWSAGSLSRQSSLGDDCVFPGDGDGAAGRCSLRRNRSFSSGSPSTRLSASGSASPLWEGSGSACGFGTLPRKSRRASVRKHLSKFIPGLQRAVEEEGSRV